MLTADSAGVMQTAPFKVFPISAQLSYKIQHQTSAAYFPHCQNH